MPHQQYVKCLVGEVTVFVLNLFNLGRSKAKHVAKVSVFAIRIHRDFAQSFVAQHR